MAKAGGLVIEVVRTKGDVARFDALLHTEHFLAETPSVGDFLRLVAVRDGVWVALLAWGPACYALQDRDDWIGWTRPLRAARQKLVVQLRRFLVLAATREPNLASQTLGACVRALPALWQDTFGYRPVLAESFSDIEQHAGTCYRAAGWLPVGESKGYSRHRADFYREHGRPKRLWLKHLQPDAIDILCSPVVPVAQRAGAASSAHGVLPFSPSAIYSLAVALRQVLDPRGASTSFRIGPVLCIVAMALLSGCRDVAEIHRFGQRLKPAQRRALGLPRGRGKGYWRVPGYNVYYNLLRRLDLDRFAAVLTGWLQAQAGKLPACLALDGKMIRDTIGVLTLADHETGVPVAVAVQTEKEGESSHCEMNAARTLLKNNPQALDGTLTTSDALHTQRHEALAITDAGGDYLCQVRDNRPKLRRLAAAKTAGRTPFLPKSRSPRAGLSSTTRSPSPAPIPSNATSPVHAHSCASQPSAATKSPDAPPPSRVTSSPACHQTP
jgi:hypothetical protein